MCNTLVEQKFEYIDNIDFSLLFRRLTDERFCSDIDPLMDEDLAKALIMKYKCFLKLNIIYPKENLLPSYGMDVMWHYHILDTVAYHRDCQYLFGTYLHHAPDFAQDGYHEKSAVSETTMDDLFMKHFNVNFKTSHHGNIF